MRGGQPVVGNNPLDANVLNSTTLQAAWVSHFVQRFGAAASGGLKYYILDNEYSLWHSTHRDVWPTGATMEQVRDLDDRVFGCDQECGSGCAGRRAGGMGLERLHLQRLRPAVRIADTAGASSPIARRMAGWTICPGCCGS